MKKLTFTVIVAVSLDAYIARREKTNAHMDWTSQEDWEFFQSKLACMDAVVVWRNTFEVAESRLRQRNTYVLSRSIQHIIQDGTVTWINPELHSLGVISEKEKFQRIAILWWKDVYTWALEQGYCDEIYITIEPVFLWGGIRFLDMMWQKNLILQSSRILNKQGTLLLHYKILWSSHP